MGHKTVSDVAMAARWLWTNLSRSAIVMMTKRLSSERQTDVLSRASGLETWRSSTYLSTRILLALTLDCCTRKKVKPGGNVCGLLSFSAIILESSSALVKTSKWFVPESIPLSDLQIRERANEWTRTNNEQTNEQTTQLQVPQLQVPQLKVPQQVHALQLTLMPCWWRRRQVCHCKESVCYDDEQQKAEQNLQRGRQHLMTSCQTANAWRSSNVSEPLHVSHHQRMMMMMMMMMVSRWEGRNLMTWWWWNDWENAFEENDGQLQSLELQWERLCEALLCMLGENA